MLILTRKPQQSITLSNVYDKEGNALPPITVVLLANDGHQAKIGFHADQSITIVRDELNKIDSAG
ncbi:carbon storage regulator [Paraferrimonas haliotis]|uniref:Carbon storage regulator n=1 Tax=Paraferrimonas haliotis TaxID=2013866 RepID=A0AA37TN46_9GAMM|nr:carbon storage regulator [Paraferrimonas haliotis]GLS83443.1 hypothetical protein GCM10007894_14200 [Paraferrimonas haliotis]